MRRKGSEKAESGKAGGVCGINTGRDGEGSGIHSGAVVERHFTSLHTFDIAWKRGKTPHECREAIIVPIYKRGSKKCDSMSEKSARQPCMFPLCWNSLGTLLSLLKFMRANCHITMSLL